MDNLLESHRQHLFSSFIKKLVLRWISSCFETVPLSHWCSVTWASSVIRFKEDSLCLWAYFLSGLQTAVNKQETLVEECGNATRTAGQMRVVKHEPNWWIMGGVMFSCESVTYCPDQTSTYMHKLKTHCPAHVESPPIKTIYPESKTDYRLFAGGLVGCWVL